MRSRIPFVLLWINAVLVAATGAESAALEEQGGRVDVVVYGATPAGVCAAVAASREGASVLLLEPTGHVGGVNTGGLCFSDSNQTIRATLLGLFEEWHLRVESEYQAAGIALPYRVSEKDHRAWTYEPHVAQRVTAWMLEEAGVVVRTNQPLKLVKKEGNRIRAVQTRDAGWEAAMFVDATYEGDLMAAAGVRWTIGREGRAEYGEQLAGRQYPKPRMAFSGLDRAGNILPLMTDAEYGPEADGDRNVMVYSFRLCVTKDPQNRVPFPAPAVYEPARFEAVRRYFAWEDKPQLPWDLYPLPGGKFDANNGIGKQFSMGLVGGCKGWCEADEEGRRAIWEAHRQYTLEFHHFLSTDPAVPEAIRSEMRELGLCRDEFEKSGHWSPQLYVREGRRMIGEYVISQSDIQDFPGKPDPVGVSSFPIDSHDCRRVGRADSVVDEGTILPVRMPGRRHGYPYQVPYRALTPKAGECGNLLVPVALSCTHVGMSSIRIEPTWMMLGQSAGIAAALCAQIEVEVQKVPYSKLRDRLLAQKQVLDLPLLPPLEQTAGIDPKTLPGILLDDTLAELEGTWRRSASFSPHIGVGYVYDERRGDGQSSAVFRFTVPETARYQVRMAYSAHATRARKVQVTIAQGGRRTELVVDQTQPLPIGEPLRSVGVVELQRGMEVVLRVCNNATDGFVILDAFQLVPLH